MRNLLATQRQKLRHTGHQGFTLIELLIVIAIIGILAGILIFVFEPFQDEAETARNLANERINDSAAAAAEASTYLGTNRSASDFVTEGSAGAGGGGGLTASFVDDYTATGTSVDIDGVQEGNLLVAVAAHRNDPTTATMADWDLRGTSDTGDDSASRIQLAVFTRIADGTESTATVNWSGSTSTPIITVTEYDLNGATPSFTAVATDGDTSTSTSLDLDPASGPSSGSALAIAAVALRENASGGPTSPSGFSFDGFTTRAAQTASTNLYVGSSTVSGSGPHGTTATWTGDMHSTGFILIAS